MQTHANYVRLCCAKRTLLSARRHLPQHLVKNLLILSQICQKIMRRRVACAGLCIREDAAFALAASLG